MQNSKELTCIHGKSSIQGKVTLIFKNYICPKINTITMNP